MIFFDDTILSNDSQTEFFFACSRPLSLLHLIFYKAILFYKFKPSNGWQGEKKGMTEIQKFEYLENKESFLDEIKNIFHSFWRAIIW